MIIVVVSLGILRAKSFPEEFLFVDTRSADWKAASALWRIVFDFEVR